MTTLPTSSTSLPSAWLDPHPRLDGLALIDHLFNRIDGMYPHRWRSAFANDQAIANWRSAWAEGLADEGVTLEEVRRGLKACRRREWPPSFAEFFASCRPPIDPESALLEAIEQMAKRSFGNDRWSHPAIYWAAVEIGEHDLRGRTVRDLLPAWRRAFGDELALGEWPPIPERRLALPSPPAEYRAETVQEMLDRLRTGSDENCKAARQ